MYRVLAGKPKGRYFLEDVIAGGRIILKLILRKSVWERGLD
jgi:hypothetical protein